MKRFTILIGLLLIKLSLFAQPTITSFTPESGPIGTVITISGTNFSATAENNIVFFGAVRGAVLGAASNSLTVQVPVGASYNLITVTTGQLMAYSRKPFSVTFTATGPLNAASFPLKTDISAPTYGPSITLFKDLDNDGKPDLIYGSAVFSIHKNNSTSGNMSFGPQTTFVVGGGPNYIAVEDMDGDGKPDIIIPGYTQPLVIYKNTSSGGTISMSAPFSFPNTVVTFGVSTQDLDGDGRPDLVTTNNEITGRFSVYRNTSSAGNISLTLTGNYATASSPRGVSFGYINSDDKPDMIIANQNGTSVSVFINNSTPGNISFAPSVNLSVPANSYPESISVGDFDGDGKDDIAVANNSNASMGTVSVFRNTGVGATVSFATPLNLTTGLNWNPYLVTAGDLDGDGKPEIAVSNQLNNAVSIFKNNSVPGTLSFDPKFDLLRMGTAARSSMAITDVDGDRRPDVISGTYPPAFVSIFSNNIQVLPVKFLSFTAIKTNTAVLLNWEVENENEQTDRYEIERSFTGTSFNKLTVIQKNPAGVGHSYHFTDPNVGLPGIKNIYYRVKQIDKDGKAAYTEIRHLNNEEEKGVYITVYPNPVNDIAVLNVFVSAAENISFRVSDASGKVVLDKISMNALEGLNKKLIDMRGMRAGVYYIKISVRNISRTVSVIKANN